MIKNNIFLFSISKIKGEKRKREEKNEMEGRGVDRYEPDMLQNVTILLDNSLEN